MDFETEYASNKEIVEKYANHVWNLKELSIIDQLIHPDVKIHSLLGDFYGKKALKGIVETWLKGFPDLFVQNHLVISEGDLVCIQWQAKGTHRGEFKGIKPTGKNVSYNGATIYRVSDGEISEYWAYLDMQHLLSQIA